MAWLLLHSTKDLNHHEKTTQIDIQYRYIQDMAMQNEVILKHISMSCMVVNPLLSQ